MIPPKLQKELPFKTKPKVPLKRKRPTLDQKRAVVMEPHEKKLLTLVQTLKTMHNEKVSLLPSVLIVIIVQIKG